MSIYCTVCDVISQQGQITWHIPHQRLSDVRILSFFTIRISRNVEDVMVPTVGDSQTVLRGHSMVPTLIHSSSSQLTLTALARQQQLVNERAESQEALRTDTDKSYP